MDAYSSGEELLVKTRKPYTITKQRERWTEEEHNKFLEALKLYGRAWQRIEEHIGTKTAVQIRSHAQKFFSKLEKEALVKGVPIEQAIDIEIPPPRPKRKPNNPYPLKTASVCSPNTQVRAQDRKQLSPCSQSSKKVADLEKEPLSDNHACDDGEQNSKVTCDADKCSEVASKLSNLNLPARKTLVNDKPNSVEIRQNDSKNDLHAAKSFPRHAPIQILDGSQGTCSQGLSSDVSYQEPRSINQQMYPSFHPAHNPLPNNQGDNSSFVQMSSTFSSLILSTLLQNPAAFAAASSVASMWPNNRDFGPQPMHPGPSMAAIAAATVAAATAWWAAHGLFPVTAPFPTGFPFPPFSNVSQTSEAKDGKKENNVQVPSSQTQQPEEELSEALRPNQLESKSSATSSSNSENCDDVMDIGVEATKDEEAPPKSELNEASKGKKQVDRSSCGSNTPSGSDVETDALGKNDKGNEELKEPEENHFVSDLNGRRIRIIGNTNDSWKEVSEEGRLAFKALFSRGRLPQSFSPPPDVTAKEQEINKTVEDQRRNSGQRNEATQLDLNCNPWESISSDQRSHSEGNVNTKDEVLTIGALQSKLSNRTGFKPYKRCSVESRTLNSSNEEQGNCSKRLRLEGEASI